MTGGYIGTETGAREGVGVQPSQRVVGLWEHKRQGVVGILHNRNTCLTVWT